MSGERLMIAGGGTGGHIYPAIAVAQEFLARDPSRTVVFVGTEYGLEKTIVPNAGFPLEYISAGGLKGKSPWQTVKNLARLPLGAVQSWRLIGHYRPSSILGVGGYSSGPVLLMAAVRGIPTVIHEANAFPGLTNRILARVARNVAVAFPEALRRMKRRGVVTGNPVRREFFHVGDERRPSERSRLRLLIFGGSQGSRIINETITASLPLLEPLRRRMEIVHQTGPSHHETVLEGYRSSAFADSRVVPYLDRMWEEIGAADLVVSRAGAMTIGELCAVGRASILVPFALATNNHQEVNARVVEQRGGAVVITERELTPVSLADAITAIISAPERAEEMGRAAHELAAPDAANKIVELIEKIQRK